MPCAPVERCARIARMPPRLVADRASLDALCQSLADSAWIALDTEFRRVDTYYAQLCLIQVATPQQVACVDPLAVTLEPLLALLARAEVSKVLHAARQDLEVLHDLTGSVPKPVFDTQIAAALAGYADQIGYANLVEAITGERLDKSQTRTDWTRRPLSAEQLAYAEDDVRYLCRVYTELEQRLRELGRLAWLEEECAALCDPALYRSEPDEAWRRVGGLSQLPARAQGIARALAAWRERTARAVNRPRGWLVKDTVLLEIARYEPDSLAALATIEGMAPGTVRRRGEELLAAVREGTRVAVAPLAAPPRLDERQQGLLRELGARVAQTSARLNIPPTVLASRQDLLALLLGNHGARTRRGWRHEAVGRELEQVVATWGRQNA